MTATTAPAPETCAERRCEEIRSRGYTVIPDAIDPERLARGRAAIDRLIASGLAPDRGAHYHAPNLVARDPVFLEIATSPTLLALAERLLGADCILSSCNLGARKSDGPGEEPGAAGLHRDTSIWGPSMPQLDCIVGMQTVWCFDDWRIANGATRIVPGSHRDPTASHLNAIPVEAAAGSVIAFDCSAIHGAGRNSAPGIRRGVLTLYIRSWLKPQTDHKRSFPAAQIDGLDPVAARLLGFQRQSPVEHPDGRSEIVRGPGATWFYGQREDQPAEYR